MTNEKSLQASDERVDVQVKGIECILDEWIAQSEIDCRGDEDCDHCVLMMHVHELARLANRECPSVVPAAIEVKETIRKLISYAESMYARVLRGDAEDINWKPLQDARDLYKRLGQTKVFQLTAGGETGRWLTEEEDLKRAHKVTELVERITELQAELSRSVKICKELEDELSEQARLNGMGSEREARLMAKVRELEAEIERLKKS